MKFSHKFSNRTAPVHAFFALCLFLLTVPSAFARGNSSTSGNTTYALGGSTTVDPIVQLAIEEFHKKNLGYTLSYDGVGSSNGIKGVFNGSYALGGSSRELKGSEESAGVRKISIAHDGMAVVTHNSTAVNSLTHTQIKDIFTGKITNWSQVGGSDAPIFVFTREESSGTRASFDDLALNKESPVNSALVVVSNGDMALKLSTTPNSIGYIGLGYMGELQDTARAILVDGYPATAEDIETGNYPLARPLYIVYTGEIEGFKKTFSDYLLSPEGQDLVAEAGYIPIR